MIEKKGEFVQALKRMNQEKGMSAYANPRDFWSLLLDYASDAKGLTDQREVFADTMTRVIKGDSLLAQVSRIRDFDLTDQKNWLRWLKEAGISETDIAFTIVCLMESFSLDSKIDQNLKNICDKGVLGNNKPARRTVKSDRKNTGVTPAKRNSTDKPRKRRIRLSSAAGRVLTAIPTIAIIALAVFFVIRKTNEQSDAAYTYLKNAMQENDTVTIASALEEKAYGKKNAGAVETLVIDYATDQCNAFNNGAEDLSTAQERVESLKSGDFAYNSTVSEKYELLSSLDDSKKCYEYAKDYESKGKYEKAIEYYKCVIKEDINYKDAQNKLKDCAERYADTVLESYEAYMASGEYEKAESVLSAALATGNTDDPRISRSQNEVQDILNARKKEQEQQEIDASLAEIKANYANDPAGMFTSLKNLSSKYSDSDTVKNELASYKQAYKDSVLNGIDSVYASGGTSGVVSYLQNALDVMGPDGDISSKLTEWKGHNTTTQLNTLDPFSDKALFWRDTTYNKDYRTDSYGTTYNSVLHTEWGGLAYTEYYIGGMNYRKLNFTVYLNKYGAQYAESEDFGDMFIKVYGDDQLLYTFNGLNHTFPPTEMSVNIEGVNIVKIESYRTTFMGITNAYLGW